VPGAGFRAAVLHLQKVIILDGLMVHIWDLKNKKTGKFSGLRTHKPTMGGSSYNGARLHAVEHFCSEHEENI